MIGQQTWSLLHTCKEFRLGTSPEIRLFQKKSQVIPLDDQKKEGHGKKTGKTRETASRCSMLLLQIKPSNLLDLRKPPPSSTIVRRFPKKEFLSNQLGTHPLLLFLDSWPPKKMDRKWILVVSQLSQQMTGFNK